MKDGAAVVASFAGAVEKIMKKRVYLGCGDIGIDCEVPGGTESALGLRPSLAPWRK